MNRLRLFGALLLAVSAGAFGLAVHDAGAGYNAEWVLGCLLTGLVSGGIGLPVTINAGRATYTKPQALRSNTHPECSGGGYLDCPDRRVYQQGYACQDYQQDTEVQRPGYDREAYTPAQLPAPIPAPPIFTPRNDPAKVR